MAIVERERTSSEIVMYALYLYFLGLSFRNTGRALEPFAERIHVAIWQWVQKFDPKQAYPCKRIAGFLIDETQMQIGGTEARLWVAIESIHKANLGVYISRHRNMLVVEASNFEIPIKQLSSLISVDKTTSIKDILDYVMNRSIRNIGIKEDLSAHKNNNGFGGDKDCKHAKLLGIINDRKIPEFLLSHNGREPMRKNGIAGLAEVNIMDNLDMASIAKVNPNTTASDAAELLMDIRNPYLIGGREEGKDDEEDNCILTPWDIVTKTLK